MTLEENIELYETEVLKRPMTEGERIIFAAGYTFAIVDSMEKLRVKE